MEMMEMLDITEMIIRARVRTVDNENDTHVLHVLIGPSIYKQSMYGEYGDYFSMQYLWVTSYTSQIARTHSVRVSIGGCTFEYH